MKPSVFSNGIRYISRLLIRLVNSTSLKSSSTPKSPGLHGLPSPLLSWYLGSRARQSPSSSTWPSPSASPQGSSSNPSKGSSITPSLLSSIPFVAAVIILLPVLLARSSFINADAPVGFARSNCWINMENVSPVSLSLSISSSSSSSNSLPMPYELSVVDFAS